MDIKELYRSTITARTSRPTNKVIEVPEGYVKSHANVASCQDDFNIYIDLNKEIKDIKFSGDGCAISTASIDMISEYVVGMNKEQATKFIDNYKNMVTGKEFDRKVLKDLIVFENVSKHLNRVSCALIGANTIKNMIGGKNE